MYIYYILPIYLSIHLSIYIHLYIYIQLTLESAACASALSAVGNSIVRITKRLPCSKGDFSL